MTIAINKSKVPLKYLIHFTKLSPSPYDLLYELAEFLESEMKDEFNDWEIRNKTKSRVGTLEDNLQLLIDEGFVEKTKYTKYRLLKHLWQ